MSIGSSPTISADSAPYFTIVLMSTPEAGTTQSREQATKVSPAHFLSTQAAWTPHDSFYAAVTSHGMWCCCGQIPNGLPSKSVDPALFNAEFEVRHWRPTVTAHKGKASLCAAHNGIKSAGLHTRPCLSPDMG
jgi:hypothetical protein